MSAVNAGYYQLTALSLRIAAQTELSRHEAEEYAMSVRRTASQMTCKRSGLNLRSEVLRSDQALRCEDA